MKRLGGLVVVSILTLVACTDAATPLGVIDPSQDPLFVENELTRERMERYILEVEPYVRMAPDGRSWELAENNLSDEALAFASVARESFISFHQATGGDEVLPGVAYSALVNLPTGSNHLRVEMHWWGMRLWYSSQLITAVNIALTQTSLGQGGLATYLAAAGIRSAPLVAAVTISVWQVIRLINAYNGGRGVVLNYQWNGWFWISSPR